MITYLVFFGLIGWLAYLFLFSGRGLTDNGSEQIEAMQRARNEDIGAYNYEYYDNEYDVYDEYDDDDDYDDDDNDIPPDIDTMTDGGD